jgi:hypothetical protein
MHVNRKKEEKLNRYASYNVCDADGMRSAEQRMYVLPCHGELECGTYILVSISALDVIMHYISRYFM